MLQITFWVSFGTMWGLANDHHHHHHHHHHRSHHHYHHHHHDLHWLDGFVKRRKCLEEPTCAKDDQATFNYKWTAQIGHDDDDDDGDDGSDGDGDSPFQLGKVKTLKREWIQKLNSIQWNRKGPVQLPWECPTKTATLQFWNISNS